MLVKKPKKTEETNEIDRLNPLSDELSKDPSEVKRGLDIKEIPPEVERFNPDISQGLTNEQVVKRQEDPNHLVNTVKDNSKTTWQIISGNVFTFFNRLLLAIAIALLTVGRWQELTFLVIAVANTLIGIIQERKAKKTIAKLKLISSENVKVIRNGNERGISVNDLVLDDIYEIKNGDQIPTDSIVKEGKIEVNESLLTGESLPVKKRVGDKIFAGSFIVSGACKAQAVFVGEYNYASSIQNKAKVRNKPKSELLRSLNSIIKVISLIIVPLGVLTFVTQFRNNSNQGYTGWKLAGNTISSTAGSMVGRIPAGRYLLVSVALASSVVHLSKKNRMVQDIYSVERLARANTLCLDKTGTLTDGTRKVDERLIIDSTYNREDLVGSYLSSFQENNQTSIALSQRFPLKNTYTAINRLPFSSARKYSAVEFKDIGVFILGAPEYLYKGRDKTRTTYIEKKQQAGYRVVRICKADGPIRDDGVKGKISPIAVFTLEDHIREQAPATIKWFTDNGVDIKIISGDNPLTASEIAKKCKVPNAEKCVSLEGLSDVEVSQIVDKYTVFGRVTPDQKALIIQTLKKQGKTVGRTGDGVNDILARKTADCSVAMANGSSAARNAAHRVLLDSNFASMPSAVGEGRRAVNNVQRSSSLYLRKTRFTIIFTIVVLCTYLNGGKGIDYPFTTKNRLILESVCIGLSSIFLALQKNESVITGHFIRNTLQRAIPAALLRAVILGLNYIFAYSNNFLELSWTEAGQLTTISQDQFTTFNVLSLAVVGISMSFNCFVPRLPLKQHWYRLLRFTIVFLVFNFAVFVLPFIPIGDTNRSKSLIGIDFRERTKTRWLLLGIYAAGSISWIKTLTTLFHPSKEKTEGTSLARGE